MALCATEKYTNGFIVRVKTEMPRKAGHFEHISVKRIKLLR